MRRRETFGDERQMEWQTAAAVGLVAGVYFWLAFVFVPPGAYWTPDAGYKRIQADDLRLTPGLDLTVDYPGQWLDPDFKFLPFDPTFYFIWKGRVHFSQPPIIAILGKPFLLVLGDRGERVVPVLAGLVSVCLVAQLMGGLAARPVWAGVLVAGLATPLLFYSLHFWEHTLAVALGLGALLAAKPSAPRNNFWSGLLAGLAGAVRKEMLLFAVVLWLKLALQEIEKARQSSPDASWKGPAAWLGGCLLAIGPYVLVAYLNSGNLVPPEFRISVEPGHTSHSYLALHGPGSLADFIFDPRYGRLGVSGGWLMVAVGLYGLASQGARTRLREAIQVAALATLGLGVGYFVWRLPPAGGLYGLLSASPFLVMGLRSSANLSRAAQRLSLVVLGFLGLTVLSLGGLTPAGPLQAGLEWGARFMLIVFPLGVPLALSGLRAVRERASRSWLARLHWALAWGLVGLSMVIQALGATRLRHTAMDAASQAALLALPEKQVLTNLWWLSAGAPRVYRVKELFYINSEPALSAWMGVAYPAGVERFAFVSYAPLDQTTAASLAPRGTTLSVVETYPLSNQMIVTRVEIAAAP